MVHFTVTKLAKERYQYHRTLPYLSAVLVVILKIMEVFYDTVLYSVSVHISNLGENLCMVCFYLTNVLRCVTNFSSKIATQNETDTFFLLGGI